MLMWESEGTLADPRSLELDVSWVSSPGPIISLPKRKGKNRNGSLIFPH